MTTLKELLSQHIGIAFGRQLAFADFLEKQNCLENSEFNVDMNQGVVTFGKDLRYPIQLLGSESYGDSSWLWAWANTASNLPENLLQSVNRLKSMGSELQIGEFTDPGFSLERAHGHLLSLIASGIHGHSCYYRAPYSGGALYFLVLDLPREIFETPDSPRLISTIMELISQSFDIDCRYMVESLFAAHQYSVQSTPDGLLAVNGSESISISFDSLGRISNIGGQGIGSTPRPPRTKKPWWKFW